MGRQDRNTDVGARNWDSSPSSTTYQLVEPGLVTLLLIYDKGCCEVQAGTVLLAGGEIYTWGKGSACPQPGSQLETDGSVVLSPSKAGEGCTGNPEFAIQCLLNLGPEEKQTGRHGQVMIPGNSNSKLFTVLSAQAWARLEGGPSLGRAQL